MSEVKVNKIINRLSATSVKVDRTTSDGAIVELQKDGTTVGNIGNFSSAIYFGQGDTTVMVDETNDQFTPRGTNGATRTDTINLGSAGSRWNNFYLGGNIYLGGTGSANALDDYEEGTYTVVVSSTGGQTATLNTSFDTCSYTKIGRVVHARGFIRPTGWDATPSGNIKISLPFANQDLSEESERGAVACHIANTGINLGDWIGLITGANSFFYIYRGNTDSLSVGDSSTYLGSGDDIHFSITYQTGS